MKCPYCSENIQPDAQKCRYCGEWLNGQAKTSNASAQGASPSAPSALITPTNAAPAASSVDRPAKCPHCGFVTPSTGLFCGRCGKAIMVRPEAAASLRPERTPITIPVPDNTSGTGNDAIVPQELRRFNWGAFLLTWLWAIAHRQWIGLLALVPGLGIIMSLIMGFKGNEWAWRNCRWDSVEHFARIQHRWKQAGFVFMLLVTLAGGYFYLAMMTVTSQNNLRTLTAAVNSYRNEHDDVYPSLGDNMRTDLAPYLTKFGASDDVFYQTNVGALYAANEDLSGRDGSEVPSPATTILFNEDQAGFDGKRSVIFADGHLVHISGAEWERIRSESTLPAKKPKVEPDMNGIGEDPGVASEPPVATDESSEGGQNSGVKPDLSPAYNVPSLIGLNYQEVVGILGEPRDKTAQVATWDNGAKLEVLLEEDGSNVAGFALSNPHGSTSDLDYLLWLGSLKQNDKRYVTELKTDNDETVLYIAPQ